MPPLYPLYLALAADIEPAAKATHSPPPQAAGQPERFSRIEVVETDLGRTAQSTERRDGYKALLAEVALGQVGIVLSYESTRWSRNCTDWYPLLDLCAYNQCLIADRDGGYDAATPNGRLLLGM